MAGIRMTTKQIEEVRMRLEAATPGPWVYRIDDNRPDWRLVWSETHPLDVAHIPPWGGGMGEGNADFIASAPSDIASLLYHIEAQDEELSLLRTCVQERDEAREMATDLALAADGFLDLLLLELRGKATEADIKSAKKAFSGALSKVLCEMENWKKETR